jgi:Protein of unknown function (DUF2950)
MIRAIVASAWIAAASHAAPAADDQPHQRTFTSPQAAAEALFLAAQADDEQALAGILGGGNEIVAGEDRAQDARDRRKFAEKYGEMHRLAREGDVIVLYVGAENWPFPLPLRAGPNGAWSFDAPSGREQILLRRIGRNELFAMDACSALRQPHADAAAVVGKPVAIEGYYFRELPSKEGHRSLLAYPAEYGSSGIMTFVVGPDDVVYERDLGPDTARIASTMTSSKLDGSWHALR